MTSSPATSADRRLPSRRIADELRAQIQRGEYPPGGRLPSERELAGRYAVARNTIREAYQLLVAEGLVTAEHGRGMFVRTLPPLMRLGANRYSRTARRQTGLSPFRIEVMRQGRTPSVTCRSITRIPAPPLVAERLGLPPPAEVVARENWYYADEEPIQTGTTYIPMSIAAASPLATEANLGPGSIYARFEDLGYQINSIREEITCRPPTHEETTGLAIPPGVPVIDLLHTSYDSHQHPFEVTRFTLRSDQCGLDYHIPTPD